MAAGYFEAGKARQKATFELTVRRLPEHRNYVIAAGTAAGHRVPAEPELQQRRDRLSPRPARSSRNVSAGFFDYLRDFRFTGDVFAVPEGTAAVRGRADDDRARADHRSADPGNVPALRPDLPDPDRHQSRAHGGGRAAAARGGVRHPPRPLSRSGRAGRRARLTSAAASAPATRWPAFATASRCSAPPRIPG